MKHGTRVEVDGSVCDTVTNESLRGMRGEVFGINAEHKGSDGQQRVNIRGEDGQCYSVPVKAIRERR